MRKFKDTRIFVNEVETQYEKNHSDIHYSEDKTSYKVVALTYPWCSGCTMNSNM
jgi:hypothetical protein